MFGAGGKKFVNARDHRARTVSESGTAGGRAARYLVSIPERAVRSAAALAGGLARELGGIALPAALRRTRLYQNLVEDTLRFLIEQVGEVEGAYPPEGRLAEDFAVRRAAGNGIELAGVLAFRASPVWVLAALADLSGAGRQLVRDIAASLQQEGLLDPGARFETVDQMLDGLEQTAGRLPETINTPPLEAAALRKEWAEIRRLAAGIPPRKLPSIEALWGHWDELRREAQAQGQTVFRLSSVLALAALGRAPENLWRLSRSLRSAARRTRETAAEALLAHYATTLREIHATGYLAYWTRVYRPYLRAAAAAFEPGRARATERWWRKLSERNR